MALMTLIKLQAGQKLDMESNKDSFWGPLIYFYV